MDDATRTGRRAYERGAWADAYDALTRASAAGALEVDDVERLAWAAVLSGNEEASLQALERLHDARLASGEVLRAARAAIWLALRAMPLGERARASAWIATAQRLVDREPAPCAERGYLLVPQVFRLGATGEHDAARVLAAEAAEIGDRHGDADLGALARNLEGRALVRLGRLSEGLPLLDEAMLAVTRGGLSPVVSGLVYCSVIAGCQQSYALDRAREWTAALREWCRAQPQLVPFTGACLVHRSEIFQLGDAWTEALDEAREASSRLAGTRDFAAGNAFYQEGELHRLRGALDEAERAYAQASERGRDPQPGLALLRLAQGRVELAAAATRRALAATRDPLPRSRLLPAHVEIMLAASDLDEARAATHELVALADRLGMDLLRAMAAQATGALALAEGAARSAIEPLRRAQEAWHLAGAPYLGARVRVLLGRAYRALGDEDGATLELDAARRLFVEVGAALDLRAIDVPAAPPPAPIAMVNAFNRISIAFDA